MQNRVLYDSTNSNNASYILKKTAYKKEYIENSCKDRDDSFQQTLRKWYLYNNHQSSLKSDVCSMQFQPVHRSACIKLSSWEGFSW